MTIPSDQSLVEAVLRGDRDTFAVLVERYTGTVIAVSAKILRDKHAAEDVAQDAFVIAYERLQSLRDGDAFGYWLIRIARRVALRAARRQRRQLVLQSSPRDSIAASVDQLSDRSQELLKLVQRLPEHERLVVMRKYFDGRSVQEIAEATGQPVSTVTKQLTRARRRLTLWIKESEQ